MPEKPKAFGHLSAEVIKKNLCSFCGACLASCDEGIIDVRDEFPAITGKCTLCGICYYQCPATNPPVPELGQELFGKGRGAGDEAELGVFRAVYTARAIGDEIRRVAQDGGAVTALLACALQEFLVDGAVVVGVEEGKPWMPKPMVATIPQDLLKAAGTKYVAGPVLMGLREAVVNYLKEKVAFVGKPCQIRAVRNMQYAPRGYLKLGGAVAFTIGLFCWEGFYYNRLIEGYLKGKGIDPAEVTKFSIEEGRFRLLKEGDILLDESVKKVGDCARGACHTCPELTSEYADVSVGRQGSRAGWSTVVVRSEAGEKLFRDACDKGFLEHKPIGREMMDKLIKVAKSKRAIAAKSETKT